MRYYLEILEKDQLHHLSVDGGEDGSGMGDIAMPFPLIQAAQRIWEESNDGVCFYKNKIDPSSEFDYIKSVDMEEFFWVKLKAVNIN